MSLIPLPIRNELHIKKQRQKGEIFYIVKDAESDGYFRFDEPQFDMINLFDGKLSISQLVAKFNERYRQIEYDSESVESLYDDLKTHKLLQRSKRDHNIALVERLKDEKRSKFLQAKGSMLLVRFHMVDPNAFFERTMDSIRFLWHPITVKTTLALMLLAFVLVCMDSSQFSTDFDRVYFNMYDNPMNFFMIWVIALVVIAFHECGHGYTCKYFGGDVNDMGFLLLVMQPCLYCNVNDAWLFESKQKKILVALAGVYTELVLATIAAFIWLIFDVDSTIGTVAFVVMTMSTAQSLIFNLNPLVKFDGYYILADSLEIVNLKQNATSWFSWILKTRLLGLELDEPFHATPREKRIYFFYGLFSTIWITLMLTTIAMLGFGLVAESFGFFGILIYLGLVAKVIAKLTNTWPKVIREWLNEKLFSNDRRRWTFSFLGLFFILSMVWHPKIQIHSDCKIQTHKEILRAPESGFISYVGYDQSRYPIHKDGVILSLDSPEIAEILSDQRNQLRALESDIQRVRAQRDNVEYRRLTEDVALLKKQISATLKQQNSLNFRIPKGSWKVMGMPPELLQGRYYKKGVEIISLVPAVTDEITTELDQSDLVFVTEGDSARVMFTDGAYYEGQLDYIPPLAITDGTERRFEARIKIDNQASLQIPEDLLCTSIISGKNIPLWRHLWRPVKRSFRADRFF